MNDQLQPLLNLLGGKLPWLPTLIVWLGALKLAGFFIGGVLQRWSAALLVRIVDSPDADDDHFLLLLIDSGFYKLLKFGLTLFSIPLPSRADYDAALQRKSGKLPPVVLLAFIVPLSLWLVAGCAPLQPGADPLVVNCERTETMAKASFDLVLHIDAAHRDFWRTNAPAFHDFCETLREPHTIGTNTLPFCSATLLALDNIKLDYQHSRVSSNALFEAITTVNSLSSQASSWLTVVTNQP